jgi:hypothetical protein
MEQEVVFHAGDDIAGGFNAGQYGTGGHHAFDGRLVSLINSAHISSSTKFGAKT